MHNKTKMTKKNKNPGLAILFGITFLSPITFSILAYEMDVVQRMFFFTTSLLLFLIFIYRINPGDSVILNKTLLFLMLAYPFTFLTCFVNESANLLILKLSDLVIPFSIIIQSALILIILGEDRFFKVVSYSVVIISTIFSIIGLLEIIQIKILDLPTIISPGSTLGHRSFAAEYLLSAIPFFLIAKKYIKKEIRIYLIISAIINISFLLLTRSRAALVLLGLLLVLYIIFVIIKAEKSEKLKTMYPVLGILFISFVISLIPVKGTQRPDFQSTASTFFDSKFKSNVLRMSFWDASFKMIKENPLNGIGLYKWSGYYPKYNSGYFTDENVTHVHSIHAHNDLLELAAENGIISSLVFLSILILITIRLFKRVRHNEKYFYFLLTFLVTIAVSFVAFPTHKFASFFLSSVVAGTALVYHKESDQTSINLYSSHFKGILFFSLIIGWTTSYIKLKSELNFGEAIFFKDRRQYSLMLERLEKISEIFYPFDTSKQPIDYYRGIANLYIGRNQDALRNNLSGQELAPFNPILMQNIASSYYSMKNLNKAIEQYEKVKKYFPNYVKPQMNLLELYTEANKTEEERQLFDELVRKYPDNPRLLHYKNKFNIE